MRAAESVESERSAAVNTASRRVTGTPVNSDRRHKAARRRFYETASGSYSAINIPQSAIPLRLDQVRLIIERQQHGLVEDHVLRKPPAVGFGETEILVAELLNSPGVGLL